MPTIIYWLLVASTHSTDVHGYILFHSKAVIGKEIMPTIIYWLIVASTHSTDTHGYSLFHSKAVIRKESAPKAFCGVSGRHLRPCLLCLIIFNRNNAKNHLLAYSSLPPPPRTFMGTVYSTVKLLSAKRALQRPFVASLAVICARAFFV